MQANEAIELIHTLASAEVAYHEALNRPNQRGLVGASKNMERVRTKAFVAMVGHKPVNQGEIDDLLWGDA